MSTASPPMRGSDAARRIRLRIFRILAGVVSAAILVLTLSPTIPDVPLHVSHADKLSHVLAFFVWAALVTAGWRWPGWLVLVVAAGFGIGIELVQPLTGRDAELADIAADMAGAAAGLWLGLRLRAGDRDAKTRDGAA